MPANSPLHKRVITLLLAGVISAPPVLVAAEEGTIVSSKRLRASPATEEPTRASETASAATDAPIVVRVNAGGRRLAGDPPWRRDTARRPSPFVVSDQGRARRTRRPLDTTHASIPASTAERMLASQRRQRGPEPMLWRFPVAPGAVGVRLYFAEIAARRQRAGARVFDVRIEGSTRLDDYDVFADVGADAAVMRYFEVESDDMLNIALRRERGAPALAGVEVVDVPDGSTAEPDPPPSEPDPPPSEPAPAPGDVAERPFAVTSAWNTPIPADPVLASNSRAAASYLGGGGRSTAVANLYEFGVPVYEATESTPRYDVECTKPWGSCGLEEQPVPIPKGARPSPGSDGAMVVIDRAANRSYEFWQAKCCWSASFGNWSKLDGSGHPATSGNATGAAISRLAGVVRADEIRRGRIDHALVFSSSNVSRRYQYPALKSDQFSTRSDALIMGQRIQLDPSIDVASIPGITPGEKAIARALQRYGAYVMDGGGARMAFIFEHPHGESDPYPAAGLAWDYYHMPHIPWDRLRVLRSWDGS